MSKSKPPHRLLPVRVVQLHGKLLAAAAIGVAVAALLPGGISLTTRGLIGWDLCVALYIVLTFAMMRRADVDSIRRRAAEEDEGAFAILLLSIIATVASLVAIVFELGASKQASSDAAFVHVVLAMGTILLSWMFVHTMFSFHYAHEYYGERRDGKIGGLRFPDDPKPDYRDFLYFSLVIGMTSQVSDVLVTSKVIRRLAAVHGVLSFLIKMTVLALTVNTVASLI